MPPDRPVSRLLALALFGEVLSFSDEELEEFCDNMDSRILSEEQDG